jgi:hypothetical protein
MCSYPVGPAIEKPRVYPETFPIDNPERKMTKSAKIKKMETGPENDITAQEKDYSEVGRRLLPDGVRTNVEKIDPVPETELEQIRKDAGVQDPLGSEGHVGGIHFSGGKEGGKRRRTSRG